MPKTQQSAYGFGAGRHITCKGRERLCIKATAEDRHGYDNERERQSIL